MNSFGKMELLYNVVMYDIYIYYTNIHLSVIFKIAGQIGFLLLMVNLKRKKKKNVAMSETIRHCDLTTQVHMHGLQMHLSVKC